ncbi:biosynthetic arginine decarboxylase [Saccharospirillum salsuginis]|uniref:Biosynthetic arginine decarboxylase n=1 Tax=Saccharospirillum salsuginis TaxID=418750 RepID=A0A918KLK1_9GAMM|nr:biosynthetic arginine decarboxylase [Saccharospirillum salsuginis]GGX67942.1 biosynthetic arginine decarboxylase [Saccharospirillum salsuginis]
MNWSVQDAMELYNVGRWSEGYFEISDDGRVTVRHPAQSIPLTRIVDAARAQGLQLPLLVRFPHILHDRVAHIVHAFQAAIDNERYQGAYQPLYPIKVNQQRRVVEEIIEGQQRVCDGRIGLEAGSKPELLAVMAEAHKGETTIVCNGYKDKEFIRLALQAERLGHRVFLVVEKASEVDWIVQLSQEMGVAPRIGVRARLSSIGKGNWQNTGGEKSKFGLTAAEVLRVAEKLREADMLEAFQLLHFHLGSQIANIRDIQVGLRECARFYVELRELGAPVTSVDVGGGLGVDYEGTRSRSACSMNYSTQEYANNVVYAFRQAAETSGQPHPAIFSESGRAVTAHHAVLITDVIEEERAEPGEVHKPDDDDVPALHELWSCYQDLDNKRRSLAELYHDAGYFLSECHQAYNLGQLTLTGRAQAEELARALNVGIRQRLNPSKSSHRAMIDDLNEKLATKLFVNFSLFQSVPDIWGIDQIFPILPITGLDREPTERGVIQDITCDSDGRIDGYVDGEGIETTLPLPHWQPNEKPWLGFFMVGAYQEILGDLHNLFGDTDSADVYFDDNGELSLSNVKRGDAIHNVLKYVDFDATLLKAAFRKQLEASTIDADTQAEMMRQFETGLDQITYLEARQATAPLD